MTRYSVLALTLSFGFVACGGSATPPPESPSIPSEPVVEAAPEAALEVEAPAAEEAEAAPAEAPEPAAEAAPEEPPRIDLIKTTSAGRPMVQYVDANGITTTLGQNGGILKLGDATLRIPDGALREGLNVTFAIAPKVKGPAKALGSVYKVGPDVHTSGPRFQIVLPVPAKAGPLSFAVEMQQPEEKARKAKVEWRTVAPTKIFTDQEPNLALLELDGLFEGHVTLVEGGAPEAAK